MVPRLGEPHCASAAPVGGASRRGERTVALGEGDVEATVWWRPGLEVGDEVVGPAVIEEPEATTFLHPKERAKVHESGSLEVSW